MRSLAKFRPSRAALFAATLASSLCASRAFAQGDVSPAPGSASSPPGDQPGVAATSTSPAPAGATPAGASTGGPSIQQVVGQVTRVIEENPVSAYPSPTPRVRGIYGGSLWIDPDFQGLQWPYIPKTGIGISGSGWVDTGVREYNAGEGTSNSTGLGAQAAKGKEFVQQSRFVLRVTPTWTDPKSQFFVQLQTEFVGAQSNASQDPIVWSVDDAWIRFGKWKLFDILVGRFQAWGSTSTRSSETARTTSLSRAALRRSMA
jgi:hypothetical protein